MGVRRIEERDSDYPPDLQERLGGTGPPRLNSIGEVAILHRGVLGFMCSVQCPGSIVIQTLDAIRELRQARVPVIGGFHSPMEHECLDILLRGRQPVVLCLARGLAGLRIDGQVRRAVEEGRLLILSPFPDHIERSNVAQAVKRNHMVAALATDLWVPHASPGGKTWSTIHAALGRQQPVFTFEDESNAELLAAGARPFERFDMSAART